MTDGPSLPGQIIVNSSDDRYGIGKSGSGGTHKALVSADAFNVSILFGPTLAFLDRVKDIMPADLMSDHDTSGFAGFLDEFVLRTFLPQLEEKVTNVFHQAVGGQSKFPSPLFYADNLQVKTRSKKIQITRKFLQSQSSRFVD